MHALLIISVVLAALLLWPQQVGLLALTAVIIAAILFISMFLIGNAMDKKGK